MFVLRGMMKLLSTKSNRSGNGLLKEFGRSRLTRSTKGSIGVPCPHCGFDRSVVNDSRAVKEDGTIRRRRICLQCSFRYTTYELYRPDYAPDYQI